MRFDTYKDVLPIDEYVKTLKPYVRENVMAVFKEKQRRGKCFDCGLLFEEEIRSCFEFDHRDPSQKSFSLGNTNRLPRTLDEVKAELERCDLCCANCHRKRTLRQIAEKKKASKKRKFIEISD